MPRIKFYQLCKMIFYLPFPARPHADYTAISRLPYVPIPKVAFLSTDNP
jgi:hypothetical protein